MLVPICRVPKNATATNVNRSNLAELKTGGAMTFWNRTICVKVLHKIKHGLLIYIVIYFQRNSVFIKTVLKKTSLFIYKVM